MSILCLRSALVPPALRSCAAIGASGVPRFWATVHDLTEMTALAESSRRTALAAIDAFYVHVEEMHGADVLDRLLARLDIDAVSCALEAFLLHDRNVAAVEQRAVSGRWHAASRFVLSTLRNVAAARGSLQNVDGIRHRLQDLDWRARQMAFAPAPREQTLRALPSGVLQDLYAIFDPASERNPFRSEAERARNYTLFHGIM